VAGGQVPVRARIEEQENTMSAESIGHDRADEIERFRSAAHYYALVARTGVEEGDHEKIMAGSSLAAMYFACALDQKWFGRLPKPEVQDHDDRTPWVERYQ
jgi:hypothetical protein